MYSPIPFSEDKVIVFDNCLYKQSYINELSTRRYIKKLIEKLNFYILFPYLNFNLENKYKTKNFYKARKFFFNKLNKISILLYHTYIKNEVYKKFYNKCLVIERNTDLFEEKTFRYDISHLCRENKFFAFIKDDKFTNYIDSTGTCFDSKINLTCFTDLIFLLESLLVKDIYIDGIIQPSNLLEFATFIKHGIETIPDYKISI